MRSKKPAGGAAGELRLTAKGLALRAALNVHMIPEINGIYDDAKFNWFWENLQEKGFFSCLRVIGPGKPGTPEEAKATRLCCASPWSSAGEATENVPPSAMLDGAVQASHCRAAKNPADFFVKGLRLTAKGLAYVVATSVGLIPVFDAFYDAGLFNRFWAELHEIGFFTYLLSLGPDKPLSSKAVEEREKDLY